MNKVNFPQGVEDSMLNGKTRDEIQMGDTFRIEITPEVARKWLKTNIENRNLSPQNLRYLVNQIKEGKWRFNGETIIFDDSGCLIDGQHRLEACVAANKPIISNVTFGIERSTFVTMDSGKQRNSADTLSTMSYKKNAQAISSAARLVMSVMYGSKGLVSGGIKGTSRFDNASVLEFVQNTEGFAETIDTAHKLWLKMPDRFVPTQVFCAAYWLFQQKHILQAKNFMESIALGTGLNTTAPAYHVRNRLIQFKQDKLSNYTVHHKLSAIVKAWNQYRKGEPMERFRFKRDEKMQEII